MNRSVPKCRECVFCIPFRAGRPDEEPSFDAYGSSIDRCAHPGGKFDAGKPKEFCRPSRVDKPCGPSGTLFLSKKDAGIDLKKKK